MPGDTVRQRSSKPSPTTKATPVNDQAEDISYELEETSPVISVLDVIRIIFTICAASCAFSYYITSGESVLWGYRPWITRPDLVKAYLKGPQRFTPEQLSLYNGTDADLPIYLAVDGIVFDVSAGRHTYGPGGSYSFFAGRDATRGFVTGCFQEDTTNDLRGVWVMNMPLDDEEEVISSGDRKIRAEREKREAKKKVQQEVRKWVDFYTNSKKYFEVGRVVQDRHVGPPPELCSSAAMMRKKRKAAKKEEATAEGKPV